jgi:hypothetical protein
MGNPASVAEILSAYFYSHSTFYAQKFTRRTRALGYSDNAIRHAVRMTHL